jgi:hypothetical protein
MKHYNGGLQAHLFGGDFLAFLLVLSMFKVLLLQGGLHISLSLNLIDSSKHKVHLFQSLALGLLQEEGDEDTHASAEASEHDESLPSNGVDGAGSDLRDDEVEEPLSGSSEADTIRAKTSGEDLYAN